MAVPAPTFRIFGKSGLEVATCAGRWVSTSPATFDFPTLNAVKDALDVGVYTYRIDGMLLGKKIDSTGTFTVLPARKKRRPRKG